MSDSALRSPATLRSVVRRFLGPTSVGDRVRFAQVMRAIGDLCGPGGRLTAPQQVRVLDAGCGEGLYAFALARKRATWQLHAVDVDARVIQACRERRKRERLANLSFERRDVLALGAARRYDLILAIDLLEHIEDHRAALRSLVEALRPGGVLVAHVPAAAQHHPFGPTRRALEAEMASGLSPHRRVGHDEHELLGELAQLGLRRAQVTHTFGPLVRLLWDLDWWLAAGRWRRPLRALLLPLTLLAPRLDSAPRRGWGNGMLVVACKT